MTEGEQRMSKALEAAHWRIKELETEVQEQCRLNGMGAERELALMAKVERLERENAELRKDAARYKWLIEYFASDDTQHDDAIVEASWAGHEAITTVIDEAMKS
jgi:hypothetical protein